MATYEHIEVQNKFVSGSLRTGVAVNTIGAKAKLAVSINVKAKTITDVYRSLKHKKLNFSTETWEKIEKSRVLQLKPFKILMWKT